MLNNEQHVKQNGKEAQAKLCRITKNRTPVIYQRNERQYKYISSEILVYAKRTPNPFGQRRLGRSPIIIIIIIIMKQLLLKLRSFFLTKIFELDFETSEFDFKVSKFKYMKSTQLA